MKNLNKIIKELSESDYNGLVLYVGDRKEGKPYQVLEAARTRNYNNDMMTEFLGVTSSTFYTLKSRLRDKIEVYLYGESANSDFTVKKEFEKWMIHSYSNNRAKINGNKRSDSDINATAYILDLDEKNEQVSKEVLFSIKTNKVLDLSTIRDFNLLIEVKRAAMGILLTLYPMPHLVEECKKCGIYKSMVMNKPLPRIQVVSVEEILEGKRLELPLYPLDAVKKVGGSLFE
ncbi:MAG: hypothetical protein NTX03_12210 [Bacteroidetes bacterium]|nr:hypothetical protein [Bacteroidota bacterium]